MKPEYPCRKHPDRESVPEFIAYRRCKECHEDALARYADDTRRSYEVTSYRDDGSSYTERWKE